MIYFSVVILAWQVDKYINECLESVRNQTFSDFEAIILAPPGNDRTAEICAAFVEKDNRFRIIETENRGQFINRITGLTAAKGEYFLCLDGDDLWVPELLRTIYDGICESRSELIIFGHERFCEDTVIKNVLGVFPDKTFFDKERKREIYEKYIQGGPINEIWGKAFSRELFQRTVVDLNKYEKIRKAEDLLYCCYLTDQAENAFYSDRALYRYRMNPEGETRTFKKDEIKDFYFVKSEIQKLMIKWRMDDERHQETLYQSLAVCTREWIFRCATSALSDAEKKALYQWLRNNELYYKKIKPYMDQVRVSKRHQLFWVLFQRSDRLLNFYGKWYVKLKNISGSHADKIKTDKKRTPEKKWTAKK